MKKHGFTLMEVLVTLGIIGIVSAMTIPALTKNWQNKTYVTQLHKVYNEFSQAFERAMAEKKATSLYEADISTGNGGGENGTQSGAKDFLHENFKIVKDCGYNYSQCFAPEYKGLNGKKRSSGVSGYSVSIAGGPAISLYMYNSTSSTGMVGAIYVDTNGLKGPNITGRDFFRMYVYGDGTIDDYNISQNCRRTPDCVRQKRQSNFNSWCFNPNDTDGCFGRLLNDDWEMKY